MRLFQVMASGGPGGAEVFFERLAPALQRAGVMQHLALRRGAPITERLRKTGLDIVELPFGGLFDFRTKPALRCAIDEFKPDVVLSWMNRATKFASRGNYTLVARLGGYYDLKYYRHCDHLVANTRGIVDYLRASGWPAERVHYLPNFVSTGCEENGVCVPVVSVSRESLATSKEAKLALALGRLHPNKGFDILISAMAKLPSFHLWLAGEGDERGVLQALAQKLGVSERVHFLGWRQDVPQLLKAADMFVCSSRHEPLGNVVIEAWAAGVPVVAAASAGPKELIKDFESGLLVPVESADALAKAMQKLADSDDLRDKLAANGRAAFEAEFSEARVVALYKEFLEKVKR